MMEQCILIRHGQTDYNVDQRFQGFTDIPLNDHGRGQARTLGEKLAAEEIEAFYASDLGRCRETVALIGHAAPVTFTPDLREANFGELEGLTFREIKQRFGNILTDWQTDSLDYAFPGGETFRVMAERVIGRFEQMRAAHRGTVALVAHAGPIHMLLANYIIRDRAELWRFWIDNCTATRLCFNGDFAYLKSLNER